MFYTAIGLNLEWLRRHGCGFSNGVPSHDAFRSLFSQLDPSLLSACLRSIAGKLRDRQDFELVSIDGKAARRLAPLAPNVQACKCASGQSRMSSASANDIEGHWRWR